MKKASLSINKLIIIILVLVVVLFVIFFAWRKNQWEFFQQLPGYENELRDIDLTQSKLDYYSNLIPDKERDIGVLVRMGDKYYFNLNSIVYQTSRGGLNVGPQLLNIYIEDKKFDGATIYAEYPDTNEEPVDDLEVGSINLKNGVLIIDIKDKYLGTFTGRGEKVGDYGLAAWYYLPSIDSLKILDGAGVAPFRADSSNNYIPILWPTLANPKTGKGADSLKVFNQFLDNEAEKMMDSGKSNTVRLVFVDEYDERRDLVFSDAKFYWSDFADVWWDFTDHKPYLTIKPHNKELKDKSGKEKVFTREQGKVENGLVRGATCFPSNMFSSKADDQYVLNIDFLFSNALKTKTGEQVYKITDKSGTTISLISVDTLEKLCNILNAQTPFELAEILMELSKTDRTMCLDGGHAVGCPTDYPYCSFASHVCTKIGTFETYPSGGMKKSTYQPLEQTKVVYFWETRRYNLDLIEIGNLLYEQDWPIFYSDEVYVDKIKRIALGDVIEVNWPSQTLKGQIVSIIDEGKERRFELELKDGFIWTLVYDEEATLKESNIVFVKHGGFNG